MWFRFLACGRRRIIFLLAGAVIAALTGQPPFSFCTPLAAAAEADAHAMVPLLEAARAQNPEIRAAEARYQAMRQRPIQERTLPDPTVGVRYHNERFDRITCGESELSFLE